MKLMMRRKNVLRLSFLIVFLTLLWSCRNEDFAQAEKNPQRNNQDFFKHSKNNDAFARAGVDYIDILEAYNREKDFLAQMPDQKGMPIWEKMQVVDAENATGLMIPLSHDDETMSSVLFATIDEKNSVIGVRDYDNSLLEKIVYNGKIDKQFREQMFYTFMFMDNKTFGTEQFTGIPQELFLYKKYDENFGRIKVKDFTISNNTTANEDAKVLFVETCNTFYSCTHHGGGGSCDHCSACTMTVCSTTVIWIPDEPFPSAGGGGSGQEGGGGGGDPIPPKDPCGSTVVFYRLAPGCGGGNTDFPDLDDPCEKIKNKFNDNKFKEKVAAIDKPEVFDYDHEMGYAAGYPPANTGVVGTQYPPMENTLGTHNVRLPDGNQYFGFMHSHNNKEGAVKIFSPGDLATFLTSCVSNADQSGNIEDAYAIVITSEGNYMLNYTGNTTNFGYNSTTKDAWMEWYVTQLKKIQNDDNTFDQDKLEKLFLRFLKEKVQINGIELYKVDKITQKVNKLSLDSNNNVIPTPCN